MPLAVLVGAAATSNRQPGRCPRKQSFARCLRDPPNGGVNIGDHELAAAHEQVSLGVIHGIAETADGEIV